jgi:hypothetical protein
MSRITVAYLSCLVGLACGFFISRSESDRATNCAEIVCAARSGRYLDGKCYEADGLREVKR